VAFWLSLHVDYACQHAGACCSAGWPIPLERDRRAVVARAIATGRIRVAEPWLLAAADQPSDADGVLAHRDGRCVFHRDQRCLIHAHLGHAALPTACQHFPRICLLDDRGVFVTLSHYCPTAAALLTSYDGPVRIVEGPDPVPGRIPEGLDARGTWPPLLAPGVLMDLPSYALWESHLIDWFGGVRNPHGEWGPHEVLSLLMPQARTLASWRPGRRTLAEAVRDFDRESPHRCDGEPFWRTYAVPINRLLAGHAFASWTAYQADGIVILIKHLQTVLDVLSVEMDGVCRRDGGPVTEARVLDAIRQTDWRLRHGGPVEN
jgi:hypothetical protein